MIEFSCKNCGQKLNVQDQYSGKRVKCPKCGSVGVVPDNSDKIKFNCENCGQSIRVPQIYAGKKGKCPKCKNIVVIPVFESLNVVESHTDSPRRPSPAPASMVSFQSPMYDDNMQAPGSTRGKLPSIFTFLGVALVGIGSVCIILRPPLGLFVLPFGVVFLVIGGLTLLFRDRGVELRAHHVIASAVGLLFILFAMILVFDDSPAVSMTLVTGMVFLVLGSFPWAYKLPSYVALAIGGTLLAAARLAGVYVPLIIGRGFVDGEIHGFLIHLINFTLGVPGIILILAGIVSFFRWLLFKTSTRLENAEGSKSLLKSKRRWFQFSLQKFLVVVTLFAYGVGWLVIWFDEPEAIRLGYSTSVVNGRIYVIGGRMRHEASPLSTVEEYDPATDTWTRKADMPTPSSRLSPCAVNGKIYVIGYSTVQEYDPVTDKWIQKSTIKALRSRRNFSTSVVNGKIYVIGGSTSSLVSRGRQIRQAGILPTVEEYDLATNNWIKKADMPTAREMLSTSVVNGKIYTIGGRIKQVVHPGGPNRIRVIRSIEVPTVEAYDPLTDTWTQKADMPTPSSRLSPCAVNGKIYVIGYSTVQEYDPVTDEWTKWTRKGDIPTGGGLSTTVVNEKIYIIKMRGDGIEGLSTVEEYDPEMDK
ncbi:MAG: kelch repeat-containing protein [Planctomycetota bacterium]|jgi:N-acetylneuraminic acid mutarotase/DNA-directed RNA polymerase subunit RPC12/RpoP